MITVQVKMAKALCRANGQSEATSLELAQGSTLQDLIASLDGQRPGLASQVLGEPGQVADHVNVYVNGDNVRYAGGIATVLRQGDQVGIIPAAAAG